MASCNMLRKTLTLGMWFVDETDVRVWDVEDLSIISDDQYEKNNGVAAITSNSEHIPKLAEQT